jgi:hypothetical protein
LLDCTDSDSFVESRLLFLDEFYCPDRAT